MAIVKCPNCENFIVDTKLTAPVDKIIHVNDNYHTIVWKPKPK